MKVKKLLAVSRGVSKICIIKNFEVVASKEWEPDNLFWQYEDNEIDYIEVDNDKTLIINVK